MGRPFGPYKVTHSREQALVYKLEAQNSRRPFQKGKMIDLDSFFDQLRTGTSRADLNTCRLPDSCEISSLASFIGKLAGL